MVLPTPATLYFVVFDRKSKIYGYTWRVGAGGTSFYIKARAPEIGLLKISLHGPDPRSDVGPPIFRMGIDHSALPRLTPLGAAFFASGFDSKGQKKFTGRQIKDNVRHVATFRSTSDLFQPGVPSAPNPGIFDPVKERGLVIPPPDIFRAADVDLFISDGAPYWWNPIQAFQDESCFGPIRNKAGQYLTGQSIRRPNVDSGIFVPEPVDISDRIRGVVARINRDEVLTIEERWMSRSYFAK